jgi:SulP family sulfate permease
MAGAFARWWRASDAGSDWHAAWSSAVIMLPQAIVLATLAGLPPEAGIYASVFSVAVAALVGKCPTVLSGPNTAIAVMVSAALTPLAAPMSGGYVRLALTLALLAGLIQLAMAALRLGRLLHLLPPFVVQGVITGVGMILITSQASALLGVIDVPGEAAWVSVWRLPEVLAQANGCALAVAVSTLAAGLLAPRLPGLRRVPTLVVALLAGCLCCAVLDALWGAAWVDLERIGFMTLQLLPLSQPHLDWQELYLLKQLLLSAAGIAFVGVLQTLIIIQGTRAEGEPAADSPDREIAAQGLGNIVNAFTSAFPGSGSFNRSASHAAAGARTYRAAVGSAVILFALGFAAAPLIARIPLAALAGTLVLIGVDMLRSVVRRHVRGRPLRAAWSLAIVAGVTVGSGLQNALIVGLLLGSFMSLRHRTHPKPAAPVVPAAPAAPEAVAEPPAGASASALSRIV